MRFELIDEPSPELREAVNIHLRTFNLQANPAWYAARLLAENESRPLNLFALDEDGQPRGGLFAETQFLWLKISILSIHADCRGQGLGTRLMNQAEAIAISRGCQFVYVDTMEYQAPRFYEKLGYTIVCRLPNWDSHGHAKVLMTKQL